MCVSYSIKRCVILTAVTAVTAVTARQQNKNQDCTAHEAEACLGIARAQCGPVQLATLLVPVVGAEVLVAEWGSYVFVAAGCVCTSMSMARLRAEGLVGVELSIIECPVACEC